MIIFNANASLCTSFFYKLEHRSENSSSSTFRTITYYVKNLRWLLEEPASQDLNDDLSTEGNTKNLMKPIKIPSSRVPYASEANSKNLLEVSENQKLQTRSSR